MSGNIVNFTAGTNEIFVIDEDTKVEYLRNGFTSDFRNTIKVTVSRPVSYAFTTAEDETYTINCTDAGTFEDSFNPTGDQPIVSWKKL